MGEHYEVKEHKSINWKIVGMSVFGSDDKYQLFSGTEDECKDFAWLMNWARGMRLAEEDLKRSNADTAKYLAKLKKDTKSGQ